MITQELYNAGIRCRSQGFCYLCKDKNKEQCVKYVNTEVKGRPPLGLIPKDIWISQRIQDIKEAIQRYQEVNKEIPNQWIEEYNELCEQINKNK